jgi:hypothetical protein
MLLKTNRFFVGIKDGKREVLKTNVAKDDLQAVYKDRYNALIGPFVTKAGAGIMAQYGANNPHCRTVAEAEHIADRWRNCKIRTLDGFTEEGELWLGLKHRPTLEEAYEAMKSLYDADECGLQNTPEFATDKNIVMAFLEDRMKERR